VDYLVSKTVTCDCIIAGPVPARIAVSRLEIYFQH